MAKKTKNKNAATLQRMIFIEDGEEFEVVCLVNQCSRGGEFTMCGCAIPDSRLDKEEFEMVGLEYKGTIKDVTCGGCLKQIGYIKSLK